MHDRFTVDRVDGAGDVRATWMKISTVQVQALTNTAG
jgi:hypothetical protein